MPRWTSYLLAAAIAAGCASAALGPVRVQVVGTVVSLDGDDLRQQPGAYVTLLLIDEASGTRKRVGEALSGAEGSFSFRNLVPVNTKSAQFWMGFLAPRSGLTAR